MNLWAGTVDKFVAQGEKKLSLSKVERALRTTKARNACCEIRKRPENRHGVCKSRSQDCKPLIWDIILTHNTKHRPPCSSQHVRLSRLQYRLLAHAPYQQPTRLHVDAHSGARVTSLNLIERAGRYGTKRQSQLPEPLEQSRRRVGQLQVL